MSAKSMGTQIRRSFTLVEVIVGAIVIALGVAFAAVMFTTGKYFLKRAENDATAVSLAIAKKEGLLAKSFSTLVPGTTSGVEGIFSWGTEVEEKSDCNSSHLSSKCVPYKEITVHVEYPDEKAANAAQSDRTKKVMVQNMVAYPYVHLSEESIPGCDDAAGCGVPHHPYRTVGNGIYNLETQLAYPVPKDVLVIYNIALNVESGAGIEESDTVFTRCFVDGVAVGVEARTPINSQPLINNIVEIDNLSVRPSNNPHTIEVRWHKDTSDGTISIKRANLILVAFER